MAKEKAPAFQFYPREFLADGNVSGMSLQERGAYITLLCICWCEGSLPLSVERLANMCGTPLKQFTKFWPAVRVCFQEHGDRYIHPRLERERDKQAAYRALQSERGKRSGESRRGTGHEPRLNRGSTGNPTKPQQDSGSTGIELSDLQSPEVPPNPPDGGLLEQEKPKLPERFLADPELADRAASLLMLYPQVYAKARAGAASPIRESRDWPKALDLAATFPDLKRLGLMVEVFLKRTDIGPKNIPGTLGQFAHMAPDCDRLLREHGR